MAKKYIITVRIPYYYKDGRLSHTDVHERTADEPKITRHQKEDLGWKLLDSRPAVEGEDYVSISLT